MTRLNLKKLHDKQRQGTKLVALTAYDASMAALLDPLVDIILVGDSLGMVIQGHPTTLPVSVSDILYHTRAVCRGSERAFIIADVPFLTATSIERALRTAGKLLARGGAQMVKFECSQQQVELVRRLAGEGIPVCAHIGYRPQTVHKSSQYFSQQRHADEQSHDKWLSEARELNEAGADILLLECIPERAAARITELSDIPVIGIGSGNRCDGQILVLYDLIGISFGGSPQFVNKLNLPRHNLETIIRSWIDDVRQVEVSKERD